MTQKPIVYYHANCLDGIVSAWVMYTKYGDTMEYVPYFYGMTVRPSYDICFVDVCPSVDILKELSINTDVNWIVIFDHHKTFNDIIRQVRESSWYDDSRKISYVHDMQRSGCMITFDETYYFGKDNETFKPMREILEYVQDQDLWNWKLPNSREIHAYLDAVTLALRKPLPEVFDTFERLTRKSNWKEEAIEYGTERLKYRNTFVDELIAQRAKPGFFHVDGKDYYIAHVEAAQFPNETGERIVNQTFTYKGRSEEVRNS